ncbi:post-GPI attachment to proteins factor 2-like isoform X1 [Haliotis asinina]|uniref:post-GPI attachment to proteins factor 2-like isoform X1 n=1 Tax=Haliotis asinina TaxID=109174 RepID=UPI003531C999
MGKPLEGTIEKVYLHIPILKFAVVTVSLPAFALLFCFVTAFLFRFDDVNDTQCNVTNFIPSISAVTGITPQSYLWRICVALHSTPRFAVAVIYYNMYKNLSNVVSKEYRGLFLKLIRLNYWLNFIENSTLVGVTYISNRDNYPIHEKLFVVFMTASLCYMLLNTIIFRWTRTSEKFSDDEEISYKLKKIMFALNFLSTMGLLYFFALHRLYCQPTAFSYFSLCEYIIGYTNMAYHISAYWDFKGMSFLAGTLGIQHTNGTVLNNNNNNSKKKR